jgi:hypothetical protein
MFIAGASGSLKRLIEAQLQATGGLDGYGVSVFSTRQFSAPVTRQVGLFLYRVEVDETRRIVDAPRTSTAPRRSTLGFELRYLLTVWDEQDAEAEQLMLARCMDIVDRHPLLSGDLLAPAYAWEPEDALRVSFANLSIEDMLRLWGSLGVPYRLSVPCVVRTARLTARERMESSTANSNELVMSPMAP